MTKKIAFLVTFLFPFVALADEAPAADPGNLFSSALEAIANKNWFMLASLGLTVAVLLLRKYVFKSTEGFFATKAGGYVMNGGLALLTSFGAALAGHGGEAFTAASLGVAALAALKSAAFASFVYTLLQDVFGLTSKPAEAK